MKESQFIEQNKEKWLEFEKNLLKNNPDPAKTSKLFVQITDDLSYARTFYEKRSVRVYLNGIAKLLFNDLNKTEKKGWNSFLNFWINDLPLTVYNARRAMLVSFLVFVSCFILGVVTSVHDPNFAATILGADYVEKTRENIRQGDAMAVYKSESELKTFLPILFNNVRVELLTFFSGIFMAVGTLVVMIRNGIMVGVFQYFFIEQGLFWPSFLTIWTHGALEISTIILSGGAGLTLGKGLLFPGTFSRSQAFILSAMNGLKIIIGVVPFTLLAAFIEGFLTRHTDLPDLLRLLLILLSFGLILLYFFYYPRKVARRHKHEPELKDNTFVYKTDIPFNPAEIYSAPKIITESFRQLFINILFFMKYLFPLSIAGGLLVAWNPRHLFRAFDNQTFSAADLYNFSEYPFLALFIGLTYIFLICRFLFFLKTKLTGKGQNTILNDTRWLRTFITVLLAVAVYIFTIFTKVTFTLLIAQLIFPFLVLNACVSHFHNLNFAQSLAYSGSLVNQSWSRFITTAVLFAMVSSVIYITFVYGLRALFLNDALAWLLTADENTAESIYLAVIGFQTFMSIFLFLTLSLISNSILYFTLLEIYTAGHLKQKIKAIKSLK